MNKKYLFPIVMLCIIVIFIVSFEVLGIWDLLGFFPPSKNRVEKIFQKCENELSVICQYSNDDNLENYDFSIDLFDSTTRIKCFEQSANGGYDKSEYTITDKKLLNTLKSVQKKGVFRILKEYDYLYFQIWGSFGESVGLIYSEGKEPDLSSVNAKKIVVERLKAENWFYCREKFE